jgi:hypothetical protein
MLLMADMRNRPLFIGQGAIALLLASPLASLLGCTSGTPSASGSTVTPATLAVGLATAFCTAEAACGSGGAIPDGGTADAGPTGSVGADGGASATTSSCAQRATLSAEQQLALVSTAFNEGLLTIDPTIATACANAYEGASCAALAGRDGPDVQAAVDNPACATLFVGYIPVGERCDMTAECVLGAYCLSQGTGQQVTALLGSGSLGVCFPLQGLGAPCNTSSDCLSALTCSPTSFTCE